MKHTLLLVLISFAIGLAYSVTTDGVITTDGLYTVVTFTINGTFNVTGSITGAEVLVVAGGGSGGRSSGGGAGGLLYHGDYNLSGDYVVTVGAGGAGTGTTNLGGLNGENSTFDTLDAMGGGGGGRADNNDAKSGGSGGGAGSGGATLSGGAGTVGQGYDGGTTSGRSNPYPGSGGGGAGGVGENAGAQGNTISGNGGIGINYTINGSTICYAGGGGGKNAWGGAGVGIGVCGGGSGNVTDDDGSSGGSGINGTGGGGAGAREGSYSGAGGSGVVIIRYLSPSAPCDYYFGQTELPLTADQTNSVYCMNESGTVDSVDAITVAAENVTINCQGFEVNTTTTGTPIVSSQTTSTIENCIITAAQTASGNGMILSGATVVTLRNNTVDNLWLTTSSDGGFILNNTIGGGDGLYMDGGTTGNTLLGNNFTTQVYDEAGGNFYNDSTSGNIWNIGGVPSWTIFDIYTASAPGWATDGYSLPLYGVDWHPWTEYNQSVLCVDAVQTISSLPATLICGNTLYNMTEGLTVDSANGITVSAENITIDCLGNTVETTTVGQGIYTSKFNTTITNCTIIAAEAGIYFEANNGTAFNNTITSGYYGTGVFNAAYTGVNIHNNTMVSGLQCFYTDGVAGTFLGNNCTSDVWVTETTAPVTPDCYDNGACTGVDQPACEAVSGCAYLPQPIGCITTAGNCNGGDQITCEAVGGYCSWTPEVIGNVFNDSTSGNIYYKADGTPSWNIYNTLTPIAPNWATSGTSLPFGSINTPTEWSGYGEDWFPWTGNELQIPGSLTVNYTIGGSAIGNNSTFIPPANLTINATADPGYYFVDWTTDCNGTIADYLNPNTQIEVLDITACYAQANFVANVPPTADILYPAPGSSFMQQTWMNFSLLGTDLESASLAGTLYINGTINETNEITNNTPWEPNVTLGYGNWDAVFEVCDAYDCTNSTLVNFDLVQNVPPTATAAYLSPIELYTGTALTGNCTATSTAGTFDIGWELLRNGISYLSGTETVQDGISKEVVSVPGGSPQSGNWVLSCRSLDLSSEMNATENLSACAPLNQTRTYTLNEDITTSGSCFNVSAPNVVFNCGGHTITGDGTGYGLTTSTGTVLENCTVHTFATDIVLAGDSNVIQNNVIGSAIALEVNTSNNLIYNNTLTADIGIQFNTGATNNTVLFNAIQSIYWVNDTQGGNFFNNSTEGNMYYLANGTAAWIGYSWFSSTGTTWADSGVNWPLNATKVPAHWSGFGTDFHPYTEKGSLPTVVALYPDSGRTVQTNSNIVRLTYYVVGADVTCTAYLNGAGVDTQFVHLKNSPSNAVNVDTISSATSNSWNVDCEVTPGTNVTSSTNSFQMIGGAAYNTSVSIGSSNGNIVSPSGFYYKADGTIGAFYYQTANGLPVLSLVDVTPNITTTTFVTNLSDGFAAVMRTSGGLGILAFENGNADFYLGANQNKTAVGYTVGSNAFYDAYAYAYTKHFTTLALDGTSYYLYSLPTSTGTIIAKATTTLTNWMPTLSSVTTATPPVAWQTIATDSALHNWYYAIPNPTGCGMDYKITIYSYDGTTPTLVATPDATCYTSANIQNAKIYFENAGANYYFLQANTSGKTVVYRINDAKSYTFTSTVIPTSQFYYYDNDSFVFFGTEGVVNYAYTCYFGSTAQCLKTAIADYGQTASYMNGALKTGVRTPAGDIAAIGTIVGQTPVLYYDNQTTDTKLICHNERDYSVLPFNARIYTNTSSLIMTTGATVMDYAARSSGIGAGQRRVYTLCTDGTSRQYFVGGSNPTTRNTYTLNTSIGKYITFNVIDCNGVVVNGIVISAQRYIPQLGAWDIVEQVMTQIDGSGTLFLEPNIPYGLMIQDSTGNATTPYTPGMNDTTITLSVGCTGAGVISPFSQPYQNIYTDLIAYVDPPQGNINLMSNVPYFNATFVATSRSGWILNSTYRIYKMSLATANVTSTSGDKTLIWSMVDVGAHGTNFTVPINTTEPSMYELEETIIMLKQNDTLSANSTNLVSYTVRGTVTVVPYNSQMQQVSDILSVRKAFSGWAWILIATVITMLVTGYMSKYSFDGAGIMGVMVLCMFAAIYDAPLVIGGFGTLTLWNIASIVGFAVVAVLVWRNG